jgi:hypothetical protein
MGKCRECERFLTFDYNLKLLCPYFNKAISDIEFPLEVNPLSFCCSNFKETKLEEV